MEGFKQGKHVICSVGVLFSQSGCSVKNGLRRGRTGKEETSQKLLQQPRQATVWSDPGWEGREGHTRSVIFGMYFGADRTSPWIGNGTGRIQRNKG